MATDLIKQLHPLHLFINELKQPTIKIKSIKTVQTIALALGFKKTRQYLVPFLGALFYQQTNDVQQAILQCLPKLIPYLGHSFYSYQLLEIVIDILCTYDEKEIRQMAFICLKNIISNMDIRKGQKMLCNTIFKLNEQKQIRFKQIVLRLIPELYIALSPQYQNRMIQIFAFYKTDEKQDIRVIVSNQIKEFIKIMPPAPEHLIKEMVELFLKDKSERVRLNMIDSIILLTQVLGQQQTLPHFKQLCTDTNTKVQSQLYQKIVQLSKVFSEANMMHFYLQIENFGQFEQELKNKIISKLAILLQIYPQDIKQRHLFQLLKPPSSLQLKSTLAEVLCQLKDEQHLAELLNQGDNEFKLKLLNKIPVISRYGQMLAGLLKHKSWRVRQNILNNFETRLANKEEDFYKIFDIVLQVLSDKVAVIRSSAADLLVKIVDKLKYPVDLLINKFQGLIKSNNWFVRIVVLQVVQKCVVNPEYSRLWELTKLLANDKVPNIRISVVKIAMVLKTYSGRLIIEQIKHLKGDEDADVRKLFD